MVTSSTVDYMYYCCGPLLTHKIGIVCICGTSCTLNSMCKCIPNFAGGTRRPVVFSYQLWCCKCTHQKENILC